MFQDILIESGLTPNEAKLYGILLTQGECFISRLTKQANMNRSMSYSVLEGLIKKGLVTKSVKGKKLHFKPNHPFILLERMQNKLTELKIKQLNIENTLPELISAYRVTENKPGVRTFEGIAGIKKAYLDTITEGKEIFAILQTSEVEPELYKWLTTTYIQKRIEKGIKAKVIAAHDAKANEYQDKDIQENRQTYLVPAEKFPIGIEVDIYGDKIAFMTFRKNADHIAIIIENKLIAHSMKALFNLAWEKAQDYNQK